MLYFIEYGLQLQNTIFDGDNNYDNALVIRNDWTKYKYVIGFLPIRRQAVWHDLHQIV